MTTSNNFTPRDARGGYFATDELRGEVDRDALRPQKKNHPLRNTMPLPASPNEHWGSETASRLSWVLSESALRPALVLL